MATYTALEALDLPAVAHRYGLPAPAASPLKGGAANSSFRLDTPDDGRACAPFPPTTSPSSRSRSPTQR